MEKTTGQLLTIGGVLTYIFFEYYVFIREIVIPQNFFSFTETYGTFVVIIVHFYLIMIVINYLLAAYTNPGDVPQNWVK